MVLRELITRFGFDVDQKGINKYDKAIGGMKRNALKAAGAVGAAFTVGSLFGLGTGKEQAKFTFERLAGSARKSFMDVFHDVKAELEGIKAGLGDTIEKTTFQKSAANFIQVLGTGNDKLKMFADLWRFSAKEAALTGKSAEAIANQLTGALSGSGNFDFLLSLPDFKQYEKEILEFLAEVQKIGDPGGELTRNLFAQNILPLIRSAGAEQDKSLDKLSDVLLQSRRASEKFVETMRNLGTTITKGLVPVLEKVGDVLDKILKLYDKTDKVGLGNVVSDQFNLPKNSKVRDMKTASDFLFGDFSGMRKTTEDDSFTKRLLEQYKINYAKSLAMVFGGGSNPVSSKKTEINVTNNFKIENPDPKVVGAIVEQRFNQKIEDAKNQIIKTEDD